MTPLSIDRTTLIPPPLRRRRRRPSAAAVGRALGLAAAAALAVTVAVRLVSRWRGRQAGLEHRGPAGDPRSASGGAPDDARLLARVESELFRDPAIPKGDISLDAAGGVVTVRGTVPPDLVEDLPTLVAAVTGVVRVESLLRADADIAG